TGSKDPFALRRQANGIVKTIAEHKLPIGLGQLLTLSRETYKGAAAETKFKRDFDYEEAIRAFFRERLEFYLPEQLAFAYDVVDACFDKVMVMVEDEQLRANRLALLQTLLKEFSTIADFSEIVTEGKS